MMIERKITMKGDGLMSVSCDSQRDMAMKWTPSEGSTLVTVKKKRKLLNCVKKFITEHKYRLNGCNNLRYELRLIQAIEDDINNR